jgi:integrase
VRAHRRVRGDRAEVDFTRALLQEQLRQAAPADHDATRWTLDELIGHYLVHLEEQGTELRTRNRYASVARVWISPVIGAKAARRLTADDIDRCFARMRKAGQSSSSMNQAKALLSGSFKWGRRTGKLLYNPMLGFQLPKSRHVPQEKLPPEAEDISLILSAAADRTPDIAPILALAATTGARLGELVALRLRDVDWQHQMLRIVAAADVDGSLKSTKRPQHHREVPLDDGTITMLRRHVAELEKIAALIGVKLDAESFLFTVEPDFSKPMLPGRVTRRLKVLKEHLGADDTRPETKALEDEALRLRRFGTVDRTGRRGPPPSQGAALSYDDIARALGRSQMWARRACDAAARRECLGDGNLAEFNLSFNGFRKFTSSELLDAGFNISVVAQRQGHGTQVLAKHYSKARMSVRRKAAEHLGRVVHGENAQATAGGDAPLE